MPNLNVKSEYELLTAENAFLTAKAQLEQAKAQKVNAENSLSYTEIKSPSDGVIGTLPYKVGALVSPEMPNPLTTVSDNSVMYVYFSLNENQMLGLLRQYGSMEKTVESMPGLKLRLSDKKMYEHEGRVESISGVVDTKTGTASIRAEFPNPDNILVSGTSGNVILPRKVSNSIVIPRSATFEIQDKVYVYKVIHGNATAVSVKVMRMDGGHDYIVHSGLTAGDVIVSEGVGLIREGQPIKVDEGDESDKVRERE
ncbi:MAG: efflux RND transporter periplasmic adaptor subunit [Clostridium sp.]|nr:efflux RND transporter periplasmic adaptor subunit [Clostridium sp.]